jgi:hypothetical protein
MTPTNQPVNWQKLQLAAANIIYDDQGVQQIQQAFQNTKSKDAYVPQVALAVVTLMHQMQQHIDELPEEAVWGKNGLVHSMIGMVSEVAWHLGYQVPKDKLKDIYEMVDQMYEQQRGTPNVDEPDEAPDTDDTQPKAPQGNMMQQAAMMGGPQ